MWVLGTEPKFSARAVNAPNHWATPPDPGIAFLGGRKTQKTSVIFLASNILSFSTGTLMCNSFLEKNLPFMLLENQLAYNSKHNRYSHITFPNILDCIVNLKPPPPCKITYVLLLHKNGLSHSNVVVKLIMNLQLEISIDSKKWLTMLWFNWFQLCRNCHVIMYKFRNIEGSGYILNVEHIVLFLFWLCVALHICGGQRTTLRSGSPLLPGNHLRCSSWAPSTFPS